LATVCRCTVGREKEICGPNSQPKHAIANRSQTVSLMLPSGEYKRAIPLLAKLILVFVIIIIIITITVIDCLS